jgi:ribosomal protein L11 methyltransferase
MWDMLLLPVPFFSLTCELEASLADDRAAGLVEAGAAGVEVREEGVLPMPGDRRPGPGRALLVAWFEGRDLALRAAVEAGVDGVVAEVEEEDWGEAWKKGLSPLTVGRVFVRPSWIAAAPPPGAAEVVLDPGMAFGTGTHPTTSLCLAALSDLLAERPGASVLDVGTGSGLLAIAAARLGAGRVAGNDVDPVAVQVARENAARNGVALELTAAPVEALRGPFQVVVANILANTLAELAPAVAAQVAPGGALLLSGLLEGQEEEVRGAYLAAGLLADPGRDATLGEWRLVALRAPPP